VAMHGICKKAGAERVSDPAATEVAKVLEGIGIKIAEGALDFTVHAGRKTVEGRNIKIV
jgi:histone H3/H4